MTPSASLIPGRVLYTLALGAYAVSFVLPAFVIVVEGRESASYGYEAFVVCFLNGGGMFGIVPFIVWLANPFFWSAAVLWQLKKMRAAAVCAGVAFVLGLLVAHSQVRAGYWLWLASMLLLGGAGLRAAFRSESTA